MKFILNDGGRKEAGYKGSTGDCAVRAAAIVTGLSYKQVYDEINELSKKERPRGKSRSNSRTGVWPKTLGKFLEKHGFSWVPCMKIGSGCKVHLDENELPTGKLVARISKHFCAIIDHIIYDTFDPQRYTIILEPGKEQRTVKRCVYGYWVKT